MRDVTCYRDSSWSLCLDIYIYKYIYIYNYVPNTFNKNKQCLLAVHYSGCGTKVSQPAASFELDMSLEVRLPATARDFPMLQWDYEEGYMFTAMMVAPGFNIMHALYINLEGYDFTTGSVSGFIFSSFFLLLFVKIWNRMKKNASLAFLLNFCSYSIVCRGLACVYRNTKIVLRLKYQC